MPDLRFGVLGPLEVLVDGRPRHVPPGRQRAVLSCLLVQAGRPVSAGALIDAAWGSDLPQDPQRALRTVLSRLRSLLGREAIEQGPAGYRLAVDPAAVDAEEFEQLRARAGSEEPRTARDLLGEALALWRGPAYGEYADATFATPLAEQLDRLRMDAVEAHASALVRTGDPGAAVAELRQLLADQPFREHAVELLVIALYRSGRQSEALEQLRHYRATLAEELGLDPSPALSRLEQRILGHTLPPAHDTSPGPPQWFDTGAAFIGREDELADLVAAVAANRVTVVTGPGGVGKSRLAAEALAPLRERLGVPIAVTELAGVSPGGAAAAVADSLGLRPRVGPPIDDLLEFLGAVPQLVLLDNCEHLLEELSPLVSTLARRCRDVHVLATSRRRLGVDSEQLIPLGPLRLPDPDSPLGAQGATASVRIFGDRVRRLRPTFAVTAENTAEVAELCRRCDGLPLALELAASRTATSGVAEVLAHLPTDLVDEERGALGAVVNWSYRLLEQDQRVLLGCLSVIPGDFTVEEVRAVMGHFSPWRGDVTSALAELVESSLVVRSAAHSVRFRLLELVRAFAALRLEGSGRSEGLRRAHATAVRDEVADIAADWRRTDGAEVSARLTRSSAGLVASLSWALRAGDISLASHLALAVVRCLHWTPGPALRDLLIEVGECGARDPGPDVAPGVAAAAFFAAERGDHDEARDLGRAALRMSRDPASAAVARLGLAVAEMYSGHHADSARWFSEMAAVPELIGEANSSLALIACYADDLATAREHADIALAAGPSGGDASYAFARYAAGEVAARTDPSRGADLLAEAAGEADRVGAEQVSRVARLALFALLVRGDQHELAVALGRRLAADLRRVGAWTQVWTMLRMLAELLAAAGRWPEAAFFLGAAHGAASAPPPVGADVLRYAALTATLSERLGARVPEQILTLAAATPRAQVLSRAEHVLAQLGPGPRPDGGPGPGPTSTLGQTVV